jgi:CubicO group peptidase (beta-lactamase class C family)
MVHTNMFVLFFVCLLSLPQDVFADPPNLTHETTSPEIKRVSDVIQKMIRKKSIAGAVALVSWKGRIIHNSTHGMRDIKEKQPLYEDSLFRIYSMTKPITSVAVMILQEQKSLI